MRRWKIFLIGGVVAAAILGFAAYNRQSSGSKELQQALDSFNSIVKTYPDKKGFHKALSHWGFKLPTGEKFEWTKDTSANKADFAMVMLADPFIKAGLNVDKLNKDEWIFKMAGREEGVDLPNLLVRPYNVSDKKEDSSGSEDALRRILRQSPDIVKYDKEGKYYNLSLGKGYEVHWTEKLGKGTSDMTFIIDAQPLISAGLDIKKLKDIDWRFKEDTKQLIKTFKLNR